MKWYIVQAHSGAEKKVAEQIKEELDKKELTKQFGETLVPTQDVTEIKKRQKIGCKKEVFSRLYFGKIRYDG